MSGSVTSRDPKWDASDRARENAHKLRNFKMVKEFLTPTEKAQSPGNLQATSSNPTPHLRGESSRLFPAAALKSRLRTSFQPISADRAWFVPRRDVRIEDNVRKIVSPQAQELVKYSGAQVVSNQMPSLSCPTVHSLELSNPAWSMSNLELRLGNVRLGPILRNKEPVEPCEPICNSNNDDDEFSESSSWRRPNQLTEAWASGQDKPPVAVFLYDGTRDAGTDHCDIDTFTGALLRPVQQPPTNKNPDSESCRHLQAFNGRQYTMTSARMMEECLEKKNLMSQEKDDVSVTRLDQHKHIEQAPTEEKPWPNARCLLRPATDEDIAGIAAVVNAEMRRENTQVLGPTVIGLQEIQKVYLQCQQDLRPFIVAVPSVNEFLDRSKWPKGADKEYEEFVQFKKLQQSSKDSNTVLGFAFVADSRMGLFGSGCHSSRFSGRITVFVHPDHRRKLYGTALLDRILLSVAVYHRSVVDYDWYCSDPALIYEHPVTKNQRKYTRLYIEVLFAGKRGAREKWVSKMLRKFDFTKVGRLGAVVYTGTEGNGTWLDSVIWEHETRPVTEITEEEPQRRI